MFRDLQYSIRSLRKRPGFAIVAVLTLALGIGVNSALFTVFNAFVLKPLPLKDPDSLVNFDGADSQGRKLRLFSYSDYQDYRKRKDVVSDIIAWNRLTVTLGEAPPTGSDDSVLAEGYEHLFGQIVSDNYFTTLGLKILEGRDFTVDDVDSKQPVAIVNASFARIYWGNQSAIGHQVRIFNPGQPQPWRTIVGVVPDTLMPWAANSSCTRWNSSLDSSSALDGMQPALRQVPPKAALPS